MLRSCRTRALTALVLLATPWFVGDRALAVEDPDFRVLLGPVGIATGQRAIVNVYAVGNPNDVGNPNEAPWNFVVRLFDRRGGLFQEQPLRLAAGVIGSVDVAIQDEEYLVGVPVNQRTTFRAEIVGFNPQPDPPGMWAATLQVFDRATGRTSLLIGNPDTLPAPTLVRSPAQ